VIGRQVGEDKRVCKTFAVLVLDAGDQYILTTITVMVVTSSPDIDAFTIRIFLEILILIILAIFSNRTTKIISLRIVPVRLGE